MNKAIKHGIILGVTLIAIMFLVQAARLPQTDGDEDNWGSILNDFLLTQHTASGGHKDLTVEGNVGIGTTNPDIVGPSNLATDTPALTLEGTTDSPALELSTKSDSLNDNAQVGVIRFFAGSLSQTQIGAINVVTEGTTEDAGNLHFWTKHSSGDITSRMTILSDGKVGIGDTNPDDLLTLNSSGRTIFRIAGASSHLRFDETDTTDQNFQFTHSVGGLLLTSNNNDFTSTVSNIMKWESDGKVGIGTVSPDDLLDVGGISRFGTNLEYGVRILGSSASNAGMTGTEPNQAIVLASTGTGDILLKSGGTAGTVRMIIEDGGKVVIKDLIGTGDAYVCVNADGELFRSNTAC